MKTIIKIVTFLLPSCTLFAQANIETVNASTSANAIAVKGTMSSTSSGTYSSSVRGENKSLNNNGYGVWGSHDGTGRGVYGVATGSGQGIGLVGESINGNGIEGNSNTGIGVGASSTNTIQALFGLATATTGYALKTDGNVYLNSIVGIGTTTISKALDVQFDDIVNQRFARVKSSNSHVLVDFDAETPNGDAALRFYKTGSPQKFNLRSIAEPTVFNFQILRNGILSIKIDGLTGKVNFQNDAQVIGNLSKGGGSFKIDHPLDPENKYLYHSFVESPDMLNIYNGNIMTDAEGNAIVEMPDYFEALNMDFQYHLTVIGGFAKAMVLKEIQNRKFEIKTNKPNIKVSWMVTGIRNDAFAQTNRIPTEVLKNKEDKGKFLHAEAFGKSEKLKIGYEESSLLKGN
jgi:hypothetical protein